MTNEILTFDIYNYSDIDSKMIVLNFLLKHGGHGNMFPIKADN